MKDEQLAKLIRKTVKKIEKAGPSNQPRQDQLIKPLIHNGMRQNMYVGRPKEFFEGKRRNVLAWFAGQIIDLVRNSNKISGNGIINCVDRFTE